jgi:hypothetical protein
MFYLGLAWLGLLLFPVFSFAEITKIVIEKREPFANGNEFGVTGPYEKLVGKAYGEVDPKNPLNKIIVGLDRAPVNSRGRVEYWADVFILKPVDMKRGNGKIFYDVPNRGSKRILMFLNDAPENNNPSTLKDAGNGFLMRQGYTIVWSGWQGDLTPGEDFLVAGFPVITNQGREIIRATRTEMVVSRKDIYSQPLSGDNRVLNYEAARTDKSQATLTIREKSYGSRTPVPNSEWDFAVCVRDKQTGKIEMKPSSRDLCIPSGYKPGYIYEFIYPAKNPLVLGLGFAVVRDLVSYLHHANKDEAGNSNPLASAGETPGIRLAYGWGRSQSGRFLRDFVYHGFNEDESHRKVFEAISPHAAGGGRLFLNYEFSRPVTSAQQHTNQLDPELFPFAYNVLKDPQTGRQDGIVKRPNTDPYIVHTQTSTEYWQKRGALAHTDGKRNDISIPNNVRIYFVASAQHNTPFGSVPRKGECQQLSNPMPIGDALRALIVAMDHWAVEGIPPPPSQIPKVADGTLISSEPKKDGFPQIPGVRYNGLYNRQLFLDYGSNLLRGKIDIHPPRQVGNGEYKVMLPKVDVDGNDRAGIRLPNIRVPLATHTGWNLQREGLAEGELCGLLGSYIPFPKTKAEREKSGDPRLSIEERYKDQADYVQQVSRAARVLVDERFLLPEDAERLIGEAKKQPVFAERKSQ